MPREHDGAARCLRDEVFRTRRALLPRLRHVVATEVMSSAKKKSKRASAARRLVVNYRERRLTLPLLLVGTLLIGFVLWNERRQEIDCSRSAGTCTLQERGVRGVVKRGQLSLSSAISVGFFKVDAPDQGPRQGLRLWNASDSVYLATTEACALGDVPCPGDQATALQAVHEFLKNDSQASVHAEYGGERGFIAGASVFLAILVLMSLFFWLDVKVTLSPSLRRVVVSQRRALFFERHLELPLDSVRLAVLACRKMGRGRSFTPSLVTDDEVIALTLPAGATPAAQRLIDDLNRALLKERRAAPTAPPRGSDSAPVPPPAAAFLLQDPIVVRSSYRGWSWIALAVAGVVLTVVLLTSQRQELHCSRRDATCRLETHRLLTTDRQTVPLANVKDVAVYKLEQGKETAQGLELLTDSAPFALPATQYCQFRNLSSLCAGDTLDAEAATRAFLKDPRRQQLDAGYGNFGDDLPGLIAVFTFFLLCTLLQWQSFRVSISASNGSVSIVRRRALLFTKYYELDLNDVEGASFD